MSGITLHGYWRSSTAYRVRIALNFKGVTYAQVTHELRSGEQRTKACRAIAPHGLVPALAVDDAILIESPAIIEWIEQHWPTPALLPANPFAAATVRAIETLIAQHGYGFAYGSTPTVADCYLVPQLYSARRFGVDLMPYPWLVAAGAAAERLPVFAAAYPDAQPDAPRP